MTKLYVHLNILYNSSNYQIRAKLSELFGDLAILACTIQAVAASAAD